MSKPQYLSDVLFMAVYRKCIFNYLFIDTPVTGCLSACVRKFPPVVMQQNQGVYSYVGVFFLFYVLQAVPTYKILITIKEEANIHFCKRT